LIDSSPEEFRELKKVALKIDPSRDHVYLPSYFESQYLTKSDMESIVYNKDFKKWMTKDALYQIEKKKFLQYKQAMNKEILRFSSFKSAQYFVELLQRIPNFRVKLT